MSTLFEINKLVNGWSWSDFEAEELSSVYLEEVLEVPHENIINIYHGEDFIEVELELSEDVVVKKWYKNLLNHSLILAA